MTKHGRLIDADALEKDGWMMHRTVQVDKATMSYQTKKPTDFPTIEPEQYGDAVSREEAKWVVFCNRDHVEDQANAIDELPSVTPKQKTGEWLPDNTNYIEERYICSNCNRSHKVETCMGKPMWDFCPSCGARMSGGEQK